MVLYENNNFFELKEKKDVITHPPSSDIIRKKLLNAYRCGNLCMTQCLVLEGDANVNVTDVSGKAPLHKACEIGDLDIVQFLALEGKSDMLVNDIFDESIPIH